VPAEKAPLGLYAIKAPFDGVIVAKHITRGERVGEESEVFTIVDLAQVWVNLTVYTKDLALIAKGQDVVLRADHSGAQARGAIAMVSPYVEVATRTATARVVLDNSDGRWVPGTFVSAFISTTEENLPVVVPRDAVQSIEGEDVVFIEHEGAFEIVPVKAGRSDRTSVEVLSGLEAGQRYVAGGAFQIKATVITSDLDPHAGHGH
jgi:cobalt-zinc-cadmium efflux system membrane fusion protein